MPSKRWKKKLTSEKEVGELLKLMKHSEYSVVKQLKKISARISLMSLILSSEPHYNALQKVLNEAYVPQDMTQRTMEYLVKRINATNYLYITKDKLDAGGTGHNKPLYITTRCKDCTIGKVLVDNNSALNVLPKHVLDEMSVDSTHILPNTIIVRAYDGFLRQMMGIIEIELSPQVFLVTLQVMNITQHVIRKALDTRRWHHDIILASVFGVYYEWNIDNN